MLENPYTETFPFEKRHWYPHLKPNDIAIWERFIKKYPKSYEHCQYDVVVGRDPEFIGNVDVDPGGDEWKLYQKKIDVVAFKGEEIDIIELKPRAGASAVGQIKMYLGLFKKDYSPPVEPKGLIITNEMTTDAREFARNEGIRVIVV